MGLMTAFIAVLVVLALIVVSLYNKLVRLRATAESAWSDIDVQLKKRYDLVPNLVETVKGYAAHEQTLFTRVTEARTLAMRAAGPAEAGRAENMLRESLKSLFAVAEAYPDLKANHNFIQLQGHLKEIEDAVEAARRYYNAVVRDLNTLVEQFPSNLVAARFKFAKKDFFELQTPALERQAVPVRF
jgi:LemA protein